MWVSSFKTDNWFSFIEVINCRVLLQRLMVIDWNLNIINRVEGGEACFPGLIAVATWLRLRLRLSWTRLWFGLPLAGLCSFGWIFELSCRKVLCLRSRFRFAGPVSLAHGRRGAPLHFGRRWKLVGGLRFMSGHGMGLWMAWLVRSANRSCSVTRLCCILVAKSLVLLAALSAPMSTVRHHTAWIFPSQDQTVPKVLLASGPNKFRWNCSEQFRFGSLGTLLRFLFAWH